MTSHAASRTPGLILVLVLLAGLSWRACAGEFSFQASSDEIFAEPHDIVLSPDGQRLYVSDVANHRIAVLDAKDLTLIRSFGRGQLSSPHDVVFDGQGRLLVADTGNSRIAIYALSGDGARLVGQLDEGISRPEGVAVHRDGRVFATGAASGNLAVYDNGRLTAQVGGFSSPHDVEFGLDGALWLADAANDRVVRLDESLNIVQELSGPRYGFRGPRYMDFDATGRMYVADKYTHRVLVIESDGRVSAVIGTGRAGKGPGVFDRPEGVEIRGDHLWLSDTYNNRIVRYRIGG